MSTIPRPCLSTSVELLVVVGFPTVGVIGVCSLLFLSGVEGAVGCFARGEVGVPVRGVLGVFTGGHVSGEGLVGEVSVWAWPALVAAEASEPRLS